MILTILLIAYLVFMQYAIKTTTYARTDKQILGLDSQRDAERDA